MISESTLSKLIEIGRSLEWDDPTLITRLSKVKADDHINRLHWREWDTVTARLRTDEVVSLIKGLVAAEEKLKWTGGSVSAIIWVFRELGRRDPDLSTQIAEWILQHTTNPYVPFGTSNFRATSLAELRSKQTAWKSRKAATTKVEAEHQEKTKTRRRKRQLEGEERVRHQKQSVDERQTLIGELQSLTPVHCLEMIASDTDHPIEFFPAEFAEVHTDVLKSLNDSTRVQLLQKLKKVGKGSWKRLRLALDRVVNETTGV